MPFEFYSNSASHLIVVLLIGLVSGATNVIAEGGSIIALPSLILLGYSGALANGTNRIALFLLNLFALRTFYYRDSREFSRSVRFTLFAIPGSILGTLAAIGMSDARYQFVLGITLLGVVASIFLNPAAEFQTNSRVPVPEWVACISMFFIGLYGGFVQAGVVVFLTIVLSSLLGMEKIRRDIYKVSIVFAYLFPTSLIFIWTRNVDWIGGATLLVGYVAGSWIGAFPFITSNNIVIRIVLAVLIVGMALKLTGIV